MMCWDVRIQRGRALEERGGGGGRGEHPSPLPAQEAVIYSLSQFSHDSVNQENKSALHPRKNSVYIPDVVGRVVQLLEYCILAQVVRPSWYSPMPKSN